jgi:hypothetical protein
LRRRAPAGLYGTRGADVRKNLTSEQLEWIGSIAIAWNELEGVIDITTAISLGIHPPLWFEVTTRINGVEGKLQLIRKTRALFPEIDQTIFNAIDRVLDATAEYKTFRDAVIHAHVLDAPAGIGGLIQRRARQEIVLLTADALKGLYNRLAILREEVICVNMTLSGLMLYLRFNPSPDDASRKRVEEEVRAYVALLQERQNDRRSLPPLPPFPNFSLDPLPTEESHREDRRPVGQDG